MDLPDLGLLGIVAKIDTGARTSALHVDHIEELPSEDGGKKRLRFSRWHSRGSVSERSWVMEVDELRKIKSSNGTFEHRFVISTPFVLGPVTATIELTLTDRSDMRYEMLIGRSAMRRRFMIDPARSFLATDGAPLKSQGE
ncbi:RimK/LysX family protein [Alteraurantiacibacter aestuarii]